MKDFGAVGKTVTGNEGNKCKYPTRLDTYGCGCTHDCKYCYAKSLLQFRGLWDAQHPSVADISTIARSIKKMPRNATALRLGGMTDCFQPIEKTHRITYKTIKLLNRYRRPYLIVTKSAMVADPEYLEILDPELAHIQITVTTTDDDLARSYEKASLPSERIRALQNLALRGFDAQLRLSPLIPGYLDFGQINSVECDKVLVEFLRANSWIRKWFDIDYSQYTVQQSGYWHLPLEAKIHYLEKITGFKEMSVCEDESRAYEYWKKYVNHNKDDCCNLRTEETAWTTKSKTSSG